MRREPAYPRVSQMYLVKVSWSGAPIGSYYAFVLLDGRLSPPEPLADSGSWGMDGSGGGGPHWDSSYVALSEHYPWLAGTASVRNTDESYPMDNDALSPAAAAEGGGVLSFYLPKPGGRDVPPRQGPAAGHGLHRRRRRGPVGAPGAARAVTRAAPEVAGRPG